MPTNGRCPFCGGTVASNERKCPECGAANGNYVEYNRVIQDAPRTIGEMKDYCARRGMPLERMRFFVGTNYTEPRAFGIYEDGDRFVVYKNKSSGERIIRYNGPDEAKAVNELFAKLLDECHIRGIYPENQPE